MSDSLIANLLKENTDLYLGTSWIPKTSKIHYPLPWKVTDVYINSKGHIAVRVEKYQGGRNSPALITLRKFKRKFTPHHE